MGIGPTHIIQTLARFWERGDPDLSGWVRAYFSGHAFEAILTGDSPLAASLKLISPAVSICNSRPRID